MKRQIQDATRIGVWFLKGAQQAWNYLGSPAYPFHFPKHAALPSAKVRRYATADYNACCDIYRLNAPGRFPEGNFDEFAKTIGSETLLFLVLEQDERIVGLGGVGLYRAASEEGANMFYGMIHPDFHRRGFGTILLFSRVALLPAPVDWWYPVRMYPVPESELYYRRFGFQSVSGKPGRRDPDGALGLVVSITSKDIFLCRKALVKSSISLNVRRDVLIRPPACKNEVKE